MERRRRHAYVQVVRGPSEGVVARLEEASFVIGRAQGCHLVLEDETVSHQHARLERLDHGGYRVVDLDSGTLVNGDEVEARELHDGDRLTIGETIVLRYGCQGEEQPAPADAGILPKTAFLARLGQTLQARPLQLAVAVLEPDRSEGLDPALVEELLEHIAQRLRPSVRGFDFLGRTGPRQLALTFPDLGLEAVNVVLERLRLQISGFPFHHLFPTVSLGATSLGSTTPEGLLAEAEGALTRAREAGGNRVTISWPETQDEKRHKIRKRCDLPVRVRLDEEFHLARLHDVSTHGVGLETGFSLPPETVLRLEHPAGTALEATVRRCLCRGPGDYLLGLSFDDPPEGSWMQAYLKSLGFTSGLPQEERRTQIRLDVDLPAALSGARAWLVNLSLGGAMLRCMTGCALGTAVEVQVNEWRALGRVVGALDKSAFWLLNVAFEPLDPAQERWIQGRLASTRKKLGRGPDVQA